ncbi:hypothetical protein VTK73DRAFT_4408 [Phialemonium thermophilum]|uniref:Uncharacterized protein n=1 Tax=Phialemonium thermophilum TaxID=223376 RepID=A0ABR3V989_9PEZI
MQRGGCLPLPFIFIFIFIFFFIFILFFSFFSSRRPKLAVLPSQGFGLLVPVAFVEPHPSIPPSIHTVLPAPKSSTDERHGASRAQQAEPATHRRTRTRSIARYLFFSRPLPRPPSDVLFAE